MFRLLADYAHNPLAPDHLAFLAQWLHRCSDFHYPAFLSPLLKPIRDSSPRQIVGTQFYQHFVSRQYAYIVHPHFPRNVCQNSHAVIQLDAKHRVWQRLDYRPFDLYRLFFCHKKLFYALLLSLAMQIM
jgi:hypothetical protein